MVRDLEDVGVKIGAAVEDRLLTGWFDVTGEQQPQTGDRDHDHQAAVVLSGGLVLADSHMVHWSDHLQFRLANAALGYRRQARSPERRCSAASRLTIADSGPGGASGLTHSWPTRRCCSTPISPSTWSAWKCVMINNGTSVIRQAGPDSLASRTGSGPVSTTTALSSARPNREPVALTDIARNQHPVPRRPARLARSPAQSR